MKREDFIYGIRPVMEALDAGREFDKLFIRRGNSSEIMYELKRKLKDKKIFYTEVPVEKLNRMVHANHQDVVGVVAGVSYSDLDHVLDQVFSKGQSPFLVLLDRITDVRNFGAIARSAECAGAHAIVIPIKGGAGVQADAIKTSAGALNYIPVCKVMSLKQTVIDLQEKGLKVFSASEKKDATFFKANLKEPMAIVLGSEEDGVSRDILELSDGLLSIPMHGKIGSLNVSVAAGILFFEAMRQRM